MKRGSHSVAPSPVALSSDHVSRKCTTGCAVLNSVLAGGIACGGITEIVGESGSAKTQLVLQLLLSVQMPLSSGGLRGKAIYLFTEGYFPDRRLQQLARFFKAQGRFEEKQRKIQLHGKRAHEILNSRVWPSLKASRNERSDGKFINDKEESSRLWPAEPSFRKDQVLCLNQEVEMAEGLNFEVYSFLKPLHNQQSDGTSINYLISHKEGSSRICAANASIRKHQWNEEPEIAEGFRVHPSLKPSHNRQSSGKSIDHLVSDKEESSRICMAEHTLREHRLIGLDREHEVAGGFSFGVYPLPKPLHNQQSDGKHFDNLLSDNKKMGQPGMVEYPEDQFSVFNQEHESSSCTIHDPCDNIFVQGVQEVEELFEVLDRLHTVLVKPSAMPVRLIVIDSVAALFRTAFDNNVKDMSARASLFFKLAGTLKRYASLFNLAVVVTNQVMDLMDDQIQNVKNFQIGNENVLISSGRMVVPALGLSWANCVNTRLFLSRWEQTIHTKVVDDSLMPNSLPEVSPGSLRVGEECSLDSPLRLDEWLEAHTTVPTTSHDKSLSKRMLQTGKEVVNPLYFDGESSAASDSFSSLNPVVLVHRKLQVVFAPHLPPGGCQFVVEEGGIRGLPNSIE